MPGKQVHQNLIRAGNIGQSLSRAEMENMSGWRGYSATAAAKHGREVYEWLRTQCGTVVPPVPITRFCDGKKHRPDIYTGLEWLSRNSFIRKEEADGIRIITVDPVPEPPEGTDPHQANKGVSVYGTRVLLEANAAGVPCAAEIADTELDDLYACFVLDTLIGRRRLDFYMELRRASAPVHWTQMEHTSRKTVAADLAYLEKWGLAVDCRHHGALVVTSPLPLDWAPADEALICDAWVDSCLESAKKSLLHKSSDLERVRDYYLDLRAEIGLSATITALDRRALSELMKDQTFDQIRPSLTYFMLGVRSDLFQSQVAQNIAGYGPTLQTYLKNLAAVEAGLAENAKAYRKNPDQAWELMLKSPRLQKWRIHPVRTYPDQDRSRLRLSNESSTKQ